MSVSVTIRGTAYTLMQDRDEDYGTYGTNLLNAMIGAINASVFMQTGTRYTRIDYTGATSTNTQSILFGSEGAGINGDNSIGIRNVNGALQYKEAGGNWTDIGTALSANTDLSNLSATVAVNDDISPDTDDTLTLGTDALEWGTVFTRLIQHGSAADPNLEISTLSNNGDILITPHGTGEIVLDGTVEIESGVIDETTNDLTITASAAGKDITIRASEDMEITATNGDLVVNSGDDMTLNASGDTLISGATIALDSASDIITTDIGGVSCPLVYSAVIQDYTAVGSVGSANQQFAGRDYTLAELEAYFTAAKVKAFYKYAVGALGTDEKGTYNRTLGAAAKAPSSGTGIMGLANTAISFDGGDYMDDENANCLLDDMTTTFSGAGKGLIHSFWVYSPTDGQPAAQPTIFFKRNSAANDLYQFYLTTTGKFGVYCRGNSATNLTAEATTTLPNGANTIWTHCIVAWNTTNGLQLYINGKLEGQDNSAAAKILMVDGTTTNFFIGGQDTTPTNPFTGLIANEVVINDVCTQAMVDFLYATKIPLPTALQGKDFKVDGRYKNLGVAADIRQFTPEITQIRSTDILLKPSIAWQSTDERRLVGEV